MTDGTSEAAREPAWVEARAFFQVDRFLAGPLLGQGGMGRVHEGWDPMLRRRVALKLLHQVEPGAILRLFNEAQTQARLDHPGIGKIYELGASPTTPYIAMQLIEGVPLGALADTLSLSGKIRLLADVAAAMHVAHRAGLIHRDIKPSNILVERRGGGAAHPILVDFGLAVDLTLTDRTLSWGMAGTPAYMSPEQARGEPLTPASDVYSLGATLYALLLGRPPFEATTLPGLLTQQAQHDAPRLRQTLPALPKDLETLVAKCLEADPRRRYASAFALEEDLRRFLAGRPLTARPVRWPERVWRTALRHQGVTATLAAALLALSLMGALGLRQRRLAARQVILAQRFGWEVKDVENLLRVERLLPAHDLRPAESRVRSELARIRQEMTGLGSWALGPGHYALGRGHLALREAERALVAFREARQAGFQGPELAYGEGLAHAALYEAGLAELNKPDVLGRPALMARLQAEHRDPALAAFRAGHGGNLESAALGEARVAFLEGDLDRCLIKCQTALVEAPAGYEAHLVAARALREKGWQAWEAGRTAESDPWMLRAGEELAEAQGIARSDPRVVAERLALMRFLAIRASESGQPDPRTFQAADRLALEALALHPGDRELWDGRMGMRFRSGFLTLSQGRDIRAWAREQLELVRREAPPGVMPGCESTFLWLLGEAQWRCGEDPRPALDRGLAAIQPGDYQEPELRTVRARYLAGCGQDPRPDLEAGQAFLRTFDTREPNEPYHHTMWGELLLARAQWEAATGRDPAASIQEGLHHLNLSVRLSPEVVYAYFHLALLHVLEARRQLARGQDPWPALDAALAAGAKAVRIRPSHYRSQLGLAEAHRAAALAEARRGGAPGPHLAQARSALDAGLAANATDFRLHLASCNLELDRYALTQAGPGALRLAEAAALKGLRSKPGDRDLTQALARCRQVQP